jgi:hypothetical protein
MLFHKPGLQYALHNSRYGITVIKIKILDNNYCSHSCSKTFTRVSDVPAE